MYWSTGSGRIELKISKRVVESCCQSGPNDDDINTAKQLNRIQSQLNGIDATLLANELKEYGAWDEDELKDHEQNKSRLLWLACWDIFDGNN